MIKKILTWIGINLHSHQSTKKLIRKNNKLIERLASKIDSFNEDFIKKHSPDIGCILATLTTDQYARVFKLIKRSYLELYDLYLADILNEAAKTNKAEEIMTYLNREKCRAMCKGLDLKVFKTMSKKALRAIKGLNKFTKTVAEFGQLAEQALLTDDVIHQAAILLIAHENDPKSQEIILQLQDIIIDNLKNNKIYKGLMITLDGKTPRIIANLKKQKKYLKSISSITDEKKLNAAKQSFLLKRAFFDALFDIYRSRDIGEALQIAEQSDYHTILLKRAVFDIDMLMDIGEALRIAEQSDYNTILLKRALFDTLMDIGEALRIAEQSDYKTNISMDIGEALRIAEQSDYNAILSKRALFDAQLDIDMLMDIGEALRIAE